jgi:hypothetical protein
MAVNVAIESVAGSNEEHDLCVFRVHNQAMRPGRSHCRANKEQIILCQVIEASLLDSWRDEKNPCQLRPLD